MKPSQKILLLSIVTAGAALYLGADSRQAPQADANTAPKRVRVATVETASEARTLRFSGVTRAERRARVAFAVGGRLASRPIEVGDRVKRGQLLARLDTRELENARATARAAVAELEARRDQTRRDLDRAERLVEAKAATDEELERARSAGQALDAAEDAARARLEESERLLEEGTLRARFAGTVTAVFYEPGEVVTPGSPVAVLAGDGGVEVEVEVPESVIRHIQEGATVPVELPVMGMEPVEGSITSVGRTTGGPGRLFPVLVALPEAEYLAAGVTAEVVLRLENDSALALPVEAVINPGGHRPSVFRVIDEAGTTRVEKVPVEVGSLLDHRVTVVGGLEEGDQIVVGGQRGLLSGEAVEVDR